MTKSIMKSPGTKHRQRRKGATGIIERLFRLGNETGSSFIEVALMMPIFTLLLLGAAEFGQVAYYSIEVNNASYAGAVYGAQNHATAADTANMQLAATEDAANISSMTVTAVSSCTCSSGTAITCGNASTNCVSPDRIAEYVQVNTSATVNSMLTYPGFPASFALHGQAIMRVEQ